MSLLVTDRRVSDVCVIIDNVILYKMKDGLYGNSVVRKRLDIMEKLCEFLMLENKSDVGQVYGEMNYYLKSAGIKGMLCLER